MLGVKLYWRGYSFCPLLGIGKLTLWFTKGITIGKAYHSSSVVYFIGWLIVSVKTKHHADFVKRVNAGTWPKNKVWNITYNKGI